MSNALSGRRALVTGAGLGIGQGIAIELGRQGAAVAVHYAGSAAGAREAVAAIEAAGGQATAIQGDLRRVAECRRVVGEAAVALGGLDILVNNAGVTRAQGFDQTTEEIYNELFDLNMRGYFFCAQAALPHLKARPGSSILNITSVHGGGGFPRHAAYAATKGAIIAFTRTLAIDLAPHQIRVNAIGPGLIETPLNAQVRANNPELVKIFLDHTPLGRAGKPEDIVGPAIFLASDLSAYVSGSIVMVDGGYRTI